MADDDPELQQLLKAEREAFERYDELRGYPPAVQVAGLTSWAEAREAVRAYRTKSPTASSDEALPDSGPHGRPTPP